MAATGDPLFKSAFYRAAREACRKQAPDVFFAAHFLPRRQRYDIYVLRAVCGQLLEIMTPPAPPDSPALPDSPDSPARPDALEPQSAAAAAGGCADCGGETPQKRRAVCAAVLDFLYSGQKTGKDELDGFHEVVQRRAIPRRLFDDFADGLEAMAEQKLYATWNRLRGVCNQSAGSVALIAVHALKTDPHSAIVPHVEQQVLAWATAIRLAAILGRLGEDVRHGRRMLPLDDLIKFGLDPKDVDGFARAGTAAGDPRWHDLMRFEVERIGNLAQGGAGCLQLLPPAARRAMTVYSGSYMDRLRQLERGGRRGLDSFGKPTRATLWSRFARLPAVVARSSRPRKDGR